MQPYSLQGVRGFFVDGWLFPVIACDCKSQADMRHRRLKYANDLTEKTAEDAKIAENYQREIGENSCNSLLFFGKLANESSENKSVNRR